MDLLSTRDYTLQTTDTHRLVFSVSTSHILATVQILQSHTIRSYLHSLPRRTVWVKSKSKAHCDWRSVSQSVSKSWCRVPEIFITLWQLRSCFCGAPSLTRGWICLLYMLLDLASAVSLGVRVSWDSRPYFTVSDFRLPFSSPTTTRWYSTPPPPAPVVFKITSRHGPRRRHDPSIVVEACLLRLSIATVAERAKWKTPFFYCCRRYVAMVIVYRVTA
jgi:hypothetical protein